MSTDALQVVALSGSLENQLDKLISNILEVFTNSYRIAIPAFFNYVVTTRVQSLANSFLGRVLAMNESCAAAEVPKLFDAKSTVLSATGAGAAFVVLVAIAFIIEKRKPKKGKRRSFRFQTILLREKATLT